MEAEKTHSLLSASWRPRKADGVIQSKSKGLRNRQASGVKSWSESKSWRPRSRCLRAGEDGRLSSSTEIEFLPPPPFVWNILEYYSAI